MMSLSGYSPGEAECSLFRVLMLNCDTLLWGPETQGFVETASAVKKQDVVFIGIHFRDMCALFRTDSNIPAPLLRCVV